MRSRDAASVLLDVPSWRNDIAVPSVLDAAPGLDPARLLGADVVSPIEAECDLIEEVLRLRGLDAVPPVTLPPLGAVPLASLTPRQARTAAARRMLAARGLAECVGFSFIARDEAEHFGAIRTACACSTRSPPTSTSSARRRWRAWRWRRVAISRAARKRWGCSRSGRALPKRARR